MGREDRTTWKSNYFMKLVQLLDEYPKCFIVGVDNVGSKQMQQIRLSLRKHAVLLMGKNTMIRKAIRGHMENNPALEKIIPHIRGNVGFVFTKEDLVEVRDKIMDNKVKAPARAGAIAPCDVKLQPQNTGLGPEKTSFFQALQIPTKISKGTIEILNEIHLIKKDDKVGASEATLLNMLNVSPFTYGLKIRQVYDSGTVFSPEILDITSEDLRAKFMEENAYDEVICDVSAQVLNDLPAVHVYLCSMMIELSEGVMNIASVSLEIGYPTLASVPHSIVNGLKNLIAIAVETDISFKEAEMAKEYLKDPSKFAAAAPAAAAPAADGGGGDKKEEAKKEESEESEDDMGFGLFD